jgi:hypothetical protein
VELLRARPDLRELLELAGLGDLAAGVGPKRNAPTNTGGDHTPDDRR